MFKALFLFSIIILGCSNSENKSGLKNFKKIKDQLVSDSIYRIAQQNTLPLGTKKCTLTFSTSSSELGILLSIHDNENTAIKAYNNVTNRCPELSLIELNQTGERLIRYEFQGIDYSIDPNRIFSKIGILNSLKKYNTTFPEEVVLGFSEFSNRLLLYVIPKSKGTYIIALHNNSENKFSINSYRNSNEAKEIYINPSCDIDDFFYVINKLDFEYFKNKKYNVVLQNTNIIDDGSLSVYCQKNNIPYINIEAQDGHLEIQKKMILETYNLLKHKNQ